MATPPESLSNLVRQSLVHLRAREVTHQCLTQIHEHQSQCLQWMRTRSGGLIANQMGTGKTLVLLHHALEKGALIVVPASLINQTMAQARTHFKYNPGEIMTYYGSSRSEYVLTHARVVVTSYETFVSERRKKPDSLLFQTKFDTLILDEAHRICNSKTATYQGLSQLSMTHRWCFTGTPFKNKVEDLRNLGSFMRLPAFPSGETDIMAWMTQHMFRVTKEQVLPHLPNKIIYDVPLPFDYPGEFLRLKQECTYDLPDGDKGIMAWNIILTKIMRLRQYCFHPGIVVPHRVRSAKFEWLSEQVNQSPGDSFLVFSQFTKGLNMLKDYLTRVGISSVLYTGDQTSSERALNLLAHESGKVQVMLLNINAGGVGLNLNWANRVVLMEPYWNTAIQDQAIDRTHRLGQKRQVIVQRLFMDRSIEKWIRNLQDKKQQISEWLFVGKELNYSEENLKRLFLKYVHSNDE